MRNLFEQVFINSEADLPSDEEKYFTHWRDTDLIETIRLIPGSKHTPQTKEFWLHMVDWYFKPYSYESEGIKNINYTRQLAQVPFVSIVPAFIGEGTVVTIYNVVDHNGIIQMQGSYSDCVSYLQHLR